VVVKVIFIELKTGVLCLPELISGVILEISESRFNNSSLDFIRGNSFFLAKIIVRYL